RPRSGTWVRPSTCCPDPATRVTRSPPRPRRSPSSWCSSGSSGGCSAAAVMTDSDQAAVEALLGRPVQGAFTVVVRHADGSPVVLRNEPLLDDGTPMPTLYWLVGEPERTQVSRLEAAGGVRRAEAEVDATELAAAHDRYAAERDALVPRGHAGPLPSGGVGG